MHDIGCHALGGVTYFLGEPKLGTRKQKKTSRRCDSPKVTTVYFSLSLSAREYYPQEQRKAKEEVRGANHENMDIGCPYFRGTLFLSLDFS